MVGIFCSRTILHLMHGPAAVPLTYGGEPISVAVIMGLISVGVMLFAGLVYSLTYFSTIMIKRASGVMLGAGIIVAYLTLQGLIGHYFPSVHLPNLIIGTYSTSITTSSRDFPITWV